MQTTHVPGVCLSRWTENKMCNAIAKVETTHQLVFVQHSPVEATWEWWHQHEQRLGASPKGMGRNSKSYADAAESQRNVLSMCHVWICHDTLGEILPASDHDNEWSHLCSRSTHHWPKWCGHERCHFGRWVQPGRMALPWQRRGKILLQIDRDRSTNLMSLMISKISKSLAWTDTEALTCLTKAHEETPVPWHGQEALQSNMLEKPRNTSTVSKMPSWLQSFRDQTLKALPTRLKHNPSLPKTSQLISSCKKNAFYIYIIILVLPKLQLEPLPVVAGVWFSKGPGLLVIFSPATHGHGYSEEGFPL